MSLQSNWVLGGWVTTICLRDFFHLWNVPLFMGRKGIFIAEIDLLKLLTSYEAFLELIFSHILCLTPPVQSQQCQ